jgi:hypothetical protein
VRGLSVLLDRFAAALEGGDVSALAELLREDVALETPPLATWFRGRDVVLGSVAANLGAAAGRFRLVPAAANGQPAFAAYQRDADGAYRAHTMIVLTVTRALITRIIIFPEPGLFRLFGLDRELAAGDSRARVSAGGSVGGSTRQENLGLGVFNSPGLGLLSLTWCLRRRHVHAILACVLARPRSPRPWLEAPGSDPQRRTFAEDGSP